MTKSLRTLLVVVAVNVLCFHQSGYGQTTLELIQRAFADPFSAKVSLREAIKSWPKRGDLTVLDDAISITTEGKATTSQVAELLKYLDLPQQTVVDRLSKEITSASSPKQKAQLLDLLNAAPDNATAFSLWLQCLEDKSSTRDATPLDVAGPMRVCDVAHGDLMNALMHRGLIDEQELIDSNVHGLSLTERDERLKSLRARLDELAVHGKLPKGVSLPGVPAKEKSTDSSAPDAVPSKPPSVTPSTPKLPEAKVSPSVTSDEPTTSTSLLVWLAVVIVATGGALWLFLRKSSK